MPAKKKRVPIPEDPKDTILFLSDRTCCVCHVRGKRVQIHHIDEDPSNNDPDNLAALCFDCHDETQIRGGVGRGLTAGQVRRFRDDWLKQVAKKREVKAGKTAVQTLITEQVRVSDQIGPTLEQQIENRIKSRELFNEAKQAMDNYNWDFAEERVKAALELYPLKEAKSYFGIKMSEALLVAFKRVHELPPGFNFEALYDGVRGRPRFVPPTANQAAYWLELAKKQNEDSTEQVAVVEVLPALALIHSYSKSYDQMMVNIKEAINYNPTMREYFTNTYHLAMLVYGCTDESDQPGAIQKLGDELGFNLPVSPQVVQQSVPATGIAINWIVMGKQSAWIGRPQPNFPIYVWIRRCEEGATVGTAGYRTPQGNGGQTFIPPDMKGLPLDQVTKTLADDFLFICQIPDFPK